MSELSLDFQVTVASYLRGAQVFCEAVVGKIVVSPYALVMLKPRNIIHLWGVGLRVSTPQSTFSGLLLRNLN